MDYYFRDLGLKVIPSHIPKSELIQQSKISEKQNFEDLSPNFYHFPASIYRWIRENFSQNGIFP